MASSENTMYYVDRREIHLNLPKSSQIGANKVLIRQGGFSEANVIVESSESRGSFSLEHNVQASTQVQRSEVSVEVDGLRETSLTSKEKVVTTRIRTVYSRSHSGSTSSTDMDHKECLDDAQQGLEDSAFSEAAAFLNQETDQRERKTSDSYYISQTYQINSEDTSRKSVTALNSVSFRSFKDVELGSQEKSEEGAALHFVDRVEAIIAGESPNVIGSPKEKHVHFHWYDIDQQNAESLKRIQSSREDVQQLIENSYMVSDIADVVGDNRLALDSAANTLGSFSEKDTSLAILQSNQASGFSGTQPVHTTGVTAYTTHEGNKTSETAIGKTLHISDKTGTVIDAAQSIDAKSVLSENATAESYKLSLSTFIGNGNTQVEMPSHSANVVKPTSFPTELDTAETLNVDKDPPATLAYSPGMAIRSYALEELAEKKSRITPERIEAKDRSRISEETSEVDLEVGSPVDDPRLLGAQAITTPPADSLPNQEYTEPKSKFHEMSKDEEDESLDKLVDLESIKVGYRFHDVGIMQESGGICNLAFDDSDENETIAGKSNHYQSLSTEQRSLTNANASKSETMSFQRSEVWSRSQLQAGNITDSQEYQSAAENSTLFLQRTPETSVITSSCENDSLSVVSSEIQETHTKLGEKKINIAKTDHGLKNNEDLQHTEQEEHIRTKSGEDPFYLRLETKENYDQRGSSSLINSKYVAEPSSSGATFTTMNPDPVVEHEEKARKGLAQTLEESKQNDMHDNKQAENRSSSKAEEMRSSIQASEWGSDFTVEAEGKETHLIHSDKYYPETEDETRFIEADNANTVKTNLQAMSVERSHTTMENKNKVYFNKTEDINKSRGSHNIAQAKKIDDAMLNTNDESVSCMSRTDTVVHTKNYNIAVYKSTSHGEVITSGNFEESDHDSSAILSETEDRTHISKVGGATSMNELRMSAAAYETDALSRETKYAVADVDAENKRRSSGNVNIDFAEDEEKYPKGNLEQVSQTSNKPNVVNVETSTVSLTEFTQQVQQVAGATRLERRQDQTDISVTTTNTGEDRKKRRFVGDSDLTYLTEINSKEKVTESNVTMLSTKDAGPLVTVTRKFNVSSKFEAGIKSVGAVLKSESMSIDVYYDTPGFDLTLSDCWLRRSNSEWQYHANFTKLLNDLTKTEYIESNDGTEILSSLAAVINNRRAEDPEATITRFVQESGLREFVRYTTTRKVYALRDMTIDLELPEYGFWVGSVTVNASKTRLHDVVSSIDSFWKSTGVQALNLLAP